jgi:NAD(P)-dependent dehydrogenase (short-subunit alcohol dehydrogenase family)
MSLTSLFDLSGKRALVTGASRGIGRACAMALGAAGAHVTLVARASTDLDDAAAALGSMARAIECDVTDLAATRAALQPLPPFDILVANAGISISKTFVEMTEPDFDMVFNLNVRATFFVAQAVVRKMLEHGLAGNVTIISSQMGQVAYPGRTAYCAAKHALEGLAKAMAVDLGPNRIRINTIAPGLVQTPFVQKIFDNPEMLSSVLKGIPLGRACQPAEVGAAAVYLASAAAAQITGACLKMDGGVTAL